MIRFDGLFLRTVPVAKTLMLVASFCCFFSDVASEQHVVVWIKNGDRLTGAITQQDKDIVFLNLPYSGQVQLP